MCRHRNLWFGQHPHGLIYVCKKFLIRQKFDAGRNQTSKNLDVTSIFKMADVTLCSKSLQHPLHKFISMLTERHAQKLRVIALFQDDVITAVLAVAQYAPRQLHLLAGIIISHDGYMLKIITLVVWL